MDNMEILHQLKHKEGLDNEEEKNVLCILSTYCITYLNFYFYRKDYIFLLRWTFS